MEHKVSPDAARLVMSHDAAAPGEMDQLVTEIRVLLRTRCEGPVGTGASY